MRHGALLVIVGGALAARAWLAVATPPIYDEYQWMHLADAVRIWSEPPVLPLHGDQHPPGQVYWAAMGTAVFGENLVGYRAASVLLGAAAVFLMYRLGRQLAGPSAGLLAAFLLSTNEYHLNISRLCTEKNYLTFVLLALVLFERALARPGVRRFVAAGGALGLGILTKQTPAVWLPALALEIVRRPETRHQIARFGPWAALGVVAICALPDLVWNLSSASHGLTGSEGMGHQLARLSIGGFSWGPLALLFRPLFFLRVEGAVSEYASMTSLAGALLFSGALASVWLIRTPQARFLQVLAFGTLAFFTFFSVPNAEFWWADLALLPMVALMAAVLTCLPGRPVIVAGVGMVMLAGAWQVVTTRDNYYPVEWVQVPPAEVARVQRVQRSLPITYADRDHAALATFAGVRLPVFASFRQALVLCDRELREVADGRHPDAPLCEWSGPRAPDDPRERREWIDRQLVRFGVRAQ